MAMSKKDYVAIAAAIFKAKSSIGTDEYSLGQTRALHDAAQSIAAHCANGNEKFDRARFLAACGVAL